MHNSWELDLLFAIEAAYAQVVASERTPTLSVVFLLDVCDELVG